MGPIGVGVKPESGQDNEEKVIHEHRGKLKVPVEEDSSVDNDQVRADWDLMQLARMLTSDGAKFEGLHPKTPNKDGDEQGLDVHVNTMTNGT